ncbi:hypothetical protein chiPu_0029355 [Chiloscyllium punctatum]|uniref:Uncharacterized protein n=1 Tax=Chiloscyllium punctatum TaxID=137246 RepID=A0A401TRR7_CHIPU|nr:hypothetical protein [Chiloscyllium punctatum]
MVPRGTARARCLSRGDKEARSTAHKPLFMRPREVPILTPRLDNHTSSGKPNVHLRTGKLPRSDVRFGGARLHAPCIAEVSRSSVQWTQRADADSILGRSGYDSCQSCGDTYRGDRDHVQRFFVQRLRKVV